jgi:chloramphenicol O-acetyltransferase type A
MTQYLDIAQWSRRATYEFYRNFEQPFFNICAMVDVTRLRNYCKTQGFSFAIAALYCGARVGNELEAFRYRLRDEGVLVHPQQDIGSTVLLENESMVFAYFKYHPDFHTFYEGAAEEMARAKSGQAFDPADDRDDLIHHSTFPWVHFTSFMHARRHRSSDSIPKMVYGKFQEQQGRVMLPVSVEVHHALMDGLHVGRYFQHFEDLCGSEQWS